MNLLSESRNNMEISNKSDENSTHPQLISEELINAMSSGNESDAESLLQIC